VITLLFCILLVIAIVRRATGARSTGGVPFLLGLVWLGARGVVRYSERKRSFGDRTDQGSSGR
jgi:hypothetical protein